MYSVYSKAYKDAEAKIKARKRNAGGGEATVGAANSKPPKKREGRTKVSTKPQQVANPSLQSTPVREIHSSSVSDLCCGSSVSSQGSTSYQGRHQQDEAKKSHRSGIFGRRNKETQQVPIQEKAQEAMDILQSAIEQQDTLESETSQTIFKLKQDAKVKLTQANKPAAIRLMRQVKRYEVKRQMISNRIETLQNQVFMIESALENAQVVRALQAGTTTMQNLNGQQEHNVEAINSIISNLQEEFDNAVEVSDLFRHASDTALSSIVGVDDDELLQELYDDVVPIATCTQAPTDLQLPMAPATMLPAPRQREERGNIAYF